MGIRIQDYLAGSGVSSVFGRIGAVVAVSGDYTWGQINKATSSIVDITTKSHIALSDIGSNTHPVIDTHIGAIVAPKYLIQQADALLPNAQAMGALGTGLVKNTITTGVQSIGVAGTDFVAPNGAITPATKTKITYDAKGLVTAGADATTADIPEATNFRFLNDAQKLVVINTSGVNTGDQTLAGLNGISHALATAIDDFLVASGAGVYVKKTLAEVKAILGLGSAAYTASTDYAVAAKGVTNGDTHDHVGGDGGQIDHANLANKGTNTHAQVDTHLGASAPHSGHIAHSLATAVNDFLVASGAGVFVKKTLAETQVILNALLIPGSSAQGDVLYHNGTSYTRLGAGTSGQLLETRGAGANPLWVNKGFDTGVVRAYQLVGGGSGSQEVPNATWTKMRLDLESFDLASEHSVVTYTTTVDKAGKYLVIGGIAWAFNATGDRFTAIYANGALYTSAILPTNSNSRPTVVIHADIIELSATNTLELYGWQGSGGPLNISEDYKTFFCVIRIN